MGFLISHNKMKRQNGIYFVTGMLSLIYKDFQQINER